MSIPTPISSATWVASLNGLTPSELDSLAALIESDASPLARRIWALIDDRIRTQLRAHPRPGRATRRFGRVGAEVRPHLQHRA